MRILLALALTLLLPTAAFAHTGVGDTAGFFHGLQHPIGGLDHVFAMVAVGVFAFVLGGRALWLVPLSFVGMMVVGFLLGAGGINVPFVEVGIALSSIVIGGAAASGRSMPVTAAMALVGAFAIFHGHAHGAEMPENAGGLLYAAGFVLATVSLHGAGLAAAMAAAKLTGSYGAALARLAGGAFALGGLGVMLGWV